MIGIKASKVGSDVNTATSDSLQFDSTYRMPKLYLKGSQPVSTGGTMTVNHNLGYLPIFKWYYVKSSELDKLYVSNLGAKLTNTQIIIINPVASDVIIYYFIFLDEVL